jgi:hypothetical protein
MAALLILGCGERDGTTTPDASSSGSPSLPEAYLPESFPEPGPPTLVPIETDFPPIVIQKPRRQCGVQYTDTPPKVIEGTFFLPPYAEVFVACFQWAQDNATEVQAVTLHDNGDGTTSVLISYFSNISDVGLYYNPAYEDDPDNWQVGDAGDYIAAAPYGGTTGVYPPESLE